MQLAESTAGLATVLPGAESELHKGFGRIHLFSLPVVISQQVFKLQAPPLLVALKHPSPLLFQVSFLCAFFKYPEWQLEDSNLIFEKLRKSMISYLRNLFELSGVAK